MRNRRFQYLMLFLFTFFVLTTNLLFSSESSGIESSEVEFLSLDLIVDKSQWGFPTLHIESEQDPFHMERLEWHEGVFSLFGEIENSHVQIRGRGNGTWHNAPNKRSLRIRFYEPQSLFDSGYMHRDWILLGNPFDRSLLRNHFIFYLAESMGGTGFVTSSRFVHLHINNIYVGVYQLTDERDSDRGRLDLLAHLNPTISEYLIELDARSEDIVVNKREYKVRFPREGGMSPQHMEYACDYINSVSEVIRDRDWAMITELIDIPSLVDFYIIQELSKDIDVGFASVFMQIKGQGTERRLYMGPVWDFDLSLGLMFTGHYQLGFDNSPEGMHAAISNYWFRYLMSIPEFREAVAKRWIDVSEHHIPSAIDEISRIARTYQEDFERNFLYHSIVAGPYLRLGENQQFETHMEHVTFLNDFIRERTAWLDEYFTSGDNDAY